MRRGDLYRVRHSGGDTRKSRVFVVVSRPALIESRHSTLVCAPVYTTRDGISTQVPVGPAQGLKHDSAIHCDGLLSLPRAALTDYVGSLDLATIGKLDEALRIALDT